MSFLDKTFYRFIDVSRFSLGSGCWFDLKLTKPTTLSWSERRISHTRTENGLDFS